VDVHQLGFALRMPLAPGVLEVADQFLLPGKAVSRAYPSESRTPSPSTPGGSFALGATVVADRRFRVTGGQEWVHVVACSPYPASIVSASSSKQIRASARAGHHTSSRASGGHCFVGYFEGA
jgi:hypothetical protein